MSVRRNRSVRTLPLDNLAILKHPLPETPNEKFFGEEVNKADSPVFEKIHVLSSDDSLDNIITNVRDLSTGKSSSSSLSWGEEYKSEASKQVRDELERMDRVLRSLESIPANYDREEYEEWMKFFPNLCVLGTSFGARVDRNVEKCEKIEEIIAMDPEDGCNKVETRDYIKTRIKAAVIDRIYQQIATKNSKINDSIDVDDYLKISPLGGVSRERFVRRRSSRSLVSSQISSSKWLKEDGEYSSLPFLTRNCQNNGVGKKGILKKNTLMLPPIEFRSVSATPRRESKSLSALSVNGRTTSRFSGYQRGEDSGNHL